MKQREAVEAEARKQEDQKRLAEMAPLLAVPEVNLYGTLGGWMNIILVVLRVQQGHPGFRIPEWQLRRIRVLDMLGFARETGESVRVSRPNLEQALRRNDDQTYSEEYENMRRVLEDAGYRKHVDWFVIPQLTSPMLSMLIVNPGAVHLNGRARLGGLVVGLALAIGWGLEVATVDGPSPPRTPPSGVLGSAPPPEFVAAESFAGARVGCVFKMGEKGLGYYLDETLDHARRLAEARQPPPSDTVVESGPILKALECITTDLRLLDWLRAVASGKVGEPFLRPTPIPVKEAWWMWVDDSDKIREQLEKAKAGRRSG